MGLGPVEAVIRVKHIKLQKQAKRISMSKAKTPALEKSSGRLRALFLMAIFTVALSVFLFFSTPTESERSEQEVSLSAALGHRSVSFNAAPSHKVSVNEPVKEIAIPINNTLLQIERQQARLAKSGEKKKYLLTLCTTVKNDVPYIVEWIEYMKIQGVERFIIYNDDSWENLTLLNQFYQQKDPSSNVMVIPRAGRPRYQLVSFQHCVDTFGDETQWILLSDTDEFLYSPSHGTLRELLLDMPALEKEANTSIHQIYADCSRFGSAGQKRRFQYRLIEEADGTVNYVNGCGVQLVLSHDRRAPHIWRPKEKELTLSLKASPICTKQRQNLALGCHHGHGKSLFRPEHLIEVGCHFPERMDGTGIQATSTYRTGHMEELARCNHYSTRSREDAFKKAIIGWRVSTMDAVVSLFNDTDAAFFGAVEDTRLRDKYMDQIAVRMKDLTTVRGECLSEETA